MTILTALAKGKALFQLRTVIMALGYKPDPIIDEAEQRRITRRIEAKRAYDAYSKHEAQRLKECRERMERAL